MNIPNNSPAAGQINEVLKNVAAMNNKVGGKRSGPKRKTRRHRKQTRKNKKARKGTRRGGGRRGNSAACEMIPKEEHVFPSLLIRIANRTQKMPGPNRPTKFYDCEEIIDDDGEVAYTGRSCDNPEFDNMIIKKDKVLSMGYAHNVDDLLSWCCHTSG